MTQLKITHIVTATFYVPYDEAHYGNDSLDEAVEYEQSIDAKMGLFEVLDDAKPNDYDHDVTVEVVE